jgi:hypothetical protein
MDLGFGSRTVLVCASTTGLGLLPRRRSSENGATVVVTGPRLSGGGYATQRGGPVMGAY